MVITAKGNYTATPGNVGIKFQMEQGGANFHPSWKWHNSKHGYRNDGGVVYKIILKYLNKKIVNDIFDNIGPQKDHEWLIIDTENATFNYKKYSRFSVRSDDDEVKMMRMMKMKILKKKKQNNLEEVF